MNAIQTITQTGVFNNGVMKGRRYTIIAKQYEFVEGVWDLIKAFMIDFEPFVKVQYVHVPRSFLLKYNVIFPFRKANNVLNVLHSINELVQFTKVSDFIKLLMVKERQDFMTIEEADEADQDDCGLEAYYLPQYEIFLVDFNIHSGGNCPMVLPSHGGSSPMAYAVGNIIDNDDEDRITKLRRRDIGKQLCFDKYEGFLKEMMDLKEYNSLKVSGFPNDVAFIYDTN